MTNGAKIRISLGSKFQLIILFTSLRFKKAPIYFSLSEGGSVRPIDWQSDIQVLHRGCPFQNLGAYQFLKSIFLVVMIIIILVLSSNEDFCYHQAT